MLDTISSRDGKESYLSRGVSVAIHALVFGLLLFSGRAAWKVRPVSTRGGTHTALLYWQGGSGTGIAKLHLSGSEKIPPQKKTAHTNPLKQKIEEPVKPRAAQTVQQASASSAGSATAQSQMSGSGSGMDDATPAFPTFSPNPPVRDRSLLPQSETNVVVDVNVSAQGEVLDEKLVRGLGNDIDRAVLDTVKGWKFHPAMVNGAPVSSMSELVFPMGQRYRA